MTKKETRQRPSTHRINETRPDRIRLDGETLEAGRDRCPVIAAIARNPRPSAAKDRVICLAVEGVDTHAVAVFARRHVADRDLLPRFAAILCPPQTRSPWLCWE